MDSPNRYKSTLSFVDLLFNILLGFVFLFLIAFLLINPVAKKGDIIVPAEYMIILTWPDGNQNDMDVWVKDPLNNIVSFRQREAGLMHLDRDDLGTTNDVVVVNGNVKEFDLNREVITLRGTVPGRYLVTVHFYFERQPGEVPATIEVVKINPFSIVYKDTKIFTRLGQEQNYYSFAIDNNGDYSGVRTTTESAIGITQ